MLRTLGGQSEDMNTLSTLWKHWGHGKGHSEDTLGTFWGQSETQTLWGHTEETLSKCWQLDRTVVMSLRGQTLNSWISERMNEWSRRPTSSSQSHETHLEQRLFVLFWALWTHHLTCHTWWTTVAMEMNNSILLRRKDGDKDLKDLIDYYSQKERDSLRFWSGSSCYYEIIMSYYKIYKYSSCRRLFHMTFRSFKK